EHGTKNARRELRWRKPWPPALSGCAPVGRQSMPRQRLHSPTEPQIQSSSALPSLPGNERNRLHAPQPQVQKSSVRLPFPELPVLDILSWQLLHPARSSRCYCCRPCSFLRPASTLLLSSVSQPGPVSFWRLPGTLSRHWRW